MRTENLLISFVAGHAIKRFHGPKKVSFLSLLSRNVYTKSPFKKTKSSKLKSKQDFKHFSVEGSVYCLLLRIA